MLLDHTDYTPTPTTTAIASPAVQRWEPTAPNEEFTYCFYVVLVHRKTNEEKLITVYSNTDSFYDVMTEIDKKRPNTNWMVWETLDTPF